MEEGVYFLDCGGYPLRVSFLYPDTPALFGGYLQSGGDPGAGTALRVTPAFLEECRWLVDENEPSLAFREFQTLMLAVGNNLLAQGRALFHGAALLWRERAWILTAPSGTGKTTQLRHWRQILKKDVEVINGDKPLLECRADGTVFVYSSPWRGKERLGRPGPAVPLGGIILLEQGKEDRIESMAPEEAVRPLFVEFISYPETTDQIRQQADILDHILDVVPVWKLINRGDEVSARLTLESLTNYLEETDYG